MTLGPRCIRKASRKPTGRRSGCRTPRTYDTSLGTCWLAAPAPEYRNWPHRVYLVTGLFVRHRFAQHQARHPARFGQPGQPVHDECRPGAAVPECRAGYSVAAYNTPVINWANLNRNLGIYGQDSWTLKRLTVSYGLRWENWSTGVREQGMTPGRFVDARTFGPEDLPAWKTVSPRTGVAYRPLRQRQDRAQVQREPVSADGHDRARHDVQPDWVAEPAVSLD